MFNDLNNPNNQSHPSVDDIFAETDKTSEAGRANSSSMANLSGISNSANSEIKAQKVGLTADEGVVDESANQSESNKWFKIILISIIALIVILSAYLVYSKFLVKPDLNSSAATPVTNTNSNAVAPVATTTVVDKIGSFVATTSSDFVATSSAVIPEIPGVNAPAATTSIVVAPPLDSDNDGLSNIEEEALGINPNIVDTDGDGLSDYEEVKIYHTNPLKPDTDGDGYSDGVEVNGGFNPLGAGKMTNSGGASSTSLVK